MPNGPRERERECKRRFLSRDYKGFFSVKTPASAAGGFGQAPLKPLGTGQAADPKASAATDPSRRFRVVCRTTGWSWLGLTSLPWRSCSQALDGGSRSRMSQNLQGRSLSPKHLQEIPRSPREISERHFNQHLHAVSPSHSAPLEIRWDVAAAPLGGADL